ncbi:MAG: TRAM domain-containing protein, partial [Nanoarchaeota archaeon]|nr:TRAM domain-containing protein [Nanoarchaeota archaeon]
FVPHVKKGDYVKIRITKVLEKVGFAEVVEKLEKPVREKKFATVSAEEMEAEKEPEIDESYDDTDDFGEELEEDD